MVETDLMSATLKVSRWKHRKLCADWFNLALFGKEIWHLFFALLEQVMFYLFFPYLFFVTIIILKENKH